MGNRNYKRPFCLDRNVPKTSWTGQSPAITVQYASVHLASRVWAAHFSRIGPACRFLVGCGLGNWAKGICRRQELNRKPVGGLGCLSQSPRIPVRSQEASWIVAIYDQAMTPYSATSFAADTTTWNTSLRTAFINLPGCASTMSLRYQRSLVTSHASRDEQAGNWDETFARSDLQDPSRAAHRKRMRGWDLGLESAVGDCLCSTSKLLSYKPYIPQTPRHEPCGWLLRSCGLWFVPYNQRQFLPPS